MSSGIEIIFWRRLVIQYNRNDVGFTRGTFRVRGDVIEINPVGSETLIRIEMFGDEIERIQEIDPITGEVLEQCDEITIYLLPTLSRLKKNSREPCQP